MNTFQQVFSLLRINERRIDLFANKEEEKKSSEHTSFKDTSTNGRNERKKFHNKFRGRGFFLLSTEFEIWLKEWQQVLSLNDIAARLRDNGENPFEKTSNRISSHGLSYSLWRLKFEGIQFYWSQRRSISMRSVVKQNLNFITMTATKICGRSHDGERKNLRETMEIVTRRHEVLIHPHRISNVRWHVDFAVVKTYSGERSCNREDNFPSVHLDPFWVSSDEIRSSRRSIRSERHWKRNPANGLVHFCSRKKRLTSSVSHDLPPSDWSPLPTMDQSDYRLS